MKQTRIAGILIIAAMVAGIFSVAPGIDSAAYLTEGAANATRVITAALSQLMMAPAYLGVAVLLYPILKQHGKTLATGFLGFRIMAATLVVIGSTLLLSLLALSKDFVQITPQDPAVFETMGSVLKASRDYINHVFMVLILCAGNALFYLLLIKSRLIPRWLSVWGLIGAALSAMASVLVMFDWVNIITPEYMLMNAPTAMQELILAIWLMVRGFDKKALVIKGS